MNKNSLFGNFILILVTITLIPSLSIPSGYLIANSDTQPLDYEHSLNLGPEGSIAWRSIKIFDDIEAPGWTAVEFSRHINGRVEWSRIVTADQDSWVNDLIRLRDGGFVAVGCTGSRYGSRYLIIKLNAYGNVEWQITTGYGPDAVARSITELPNNKLLVSGYLEHEDMLRPYFVELNESGTILSIWPVLNPRIT